MSAISQKSISGITSITSPAGTDDQISLHTSNTNEALKIDGAGNLHLNNHVNTTGVTTASNFKTGSSNLHSTGLTVGDSFVHSTGFNVGSNIKLGTTGVITATSFSGDGSNLTSLPAGLGTALSSTQTDPLNKLYYTNQVLGVGATITVDPPASASKAYTQYADIKVDSDADLIIAEGDDLIPDVLGLADFGNFGGGASAGRIRVNSITNAAANGATTIQNGVVISGMTTITGGLSIGGTITYEDVTNIDSIGIITARSGVDVDDFISVGSNIHLGNAGIITASSYRGDGSQLTGIVADKIFEGNTEVETIDTGSDGHVKITTEGTERLRIDTAGNMSLGKGSDASTNYGRQIQIHSTLTSGAALHLTNITSGSTNSDGFHLVQQGHIYHWLREDAHQIFATQGLERMRLTSGGDVLIGTTSDSNQKLTLYGTNAAVAIQNSNTGTGANNGIYIGNGNGTIAYIWNYENDSMRFATNDTEKLRIDTSGTLTNFTTSSHSQGAGTFNIKGVINQYSQGSGSGLIFDCDFGRITGYSDDSNVSDGTNLSACLSHSTTDWSSSSSNTPMTVNGGTFQYRTGFGGYFDAISNGGRVSIAAGSGSPNMAETLNTASMTVEAWCWYDGDGREVIASRFGSGFPNQFNMIADPNGQFHYNSGGVGASGGNVSGEHFPDKTWHHHVWQYDAAVGTMHRWYINGCFANSRDVGSSVAVSSNTGFSIASRSDRYEDWRGKIAIVRIYNRALSAIEIKNHFELERGRFGV